MKILLLLITCFALTAADLSINEQWISFKAEYKKKYSNPEEENSRLSVFLENMKEIEEHNKKYAEGKVSYSLRINQFGDLTPKEFSSKFTGYIKKPPTTKSNFTNKFTYSLNDKLPESFDWRDKGAVTPVKNQGSCQGCWSFSATGAMEGQLFLSSGKLVSLSEQQLIDCSTSYGNMGCQGGIMERTFEYIKDAEGIMSEDAYPFLGKDGKCIFSINSVVNGTKISSFEELPEGNEEALQAAVATKGPVSVALAASSKSFMLYHEGILTSEGCGNKLDHAVLVVGYGRESDMDYWLVKNSWGTRWGEKGYIKIARNQQNTCGLASYPIYPIMDKTGKDDKPPSSKAWKTVFSSGKLVFASLLFVYLSIKI